MHSVSLKPAIAVVVLAVFASGLVGCGRKGALEAPSAYQKDGQSGQAQKEQPVQDKPFFLDPLL